MPRPTARRLVAWSWPEVDPVTLHSSMVVISRDIDGRWYATFAVDTDIPTPFEPAGHEIGLDLG